MARATTCSLSSLAERPDGESVKVGGLIGDTKSVTTRRGEPMMFVRLDDLTASVEIVVVPAVLNEAREAIQPEGIVTVSGRVDQKAEGETKVVAQAIDAFHVDPAAEEQRFEVRISPEGLAAGGLNELRRVIADHRGEVPVVVEMATRRGARRLRLGPEFAVDARDTNLTASLKTLFGERCVAST